jgi:hypothetical protein
LNELESYSGNLKSEIVTNDGDLNLESNSSYLFQNDPNPFNIETKIRYSILEEVTDAAIYLFDLQGKQIKSYIISDRGVSNISIYANELEPGIYLCTMITDGIEVNTNRMILTE